MLCGVPTPFVPLIKNVCAVSPPCNSVPLPHLALSWILSKVENLASSNLSDEATDCFCHTRAPSWILSYAENLSSSSFQDGATKWLYYAVGTTHPPNVSVGELFLSMLCSVPHQIVLLSWMYVPCPPLPEYVFSVLCPPHVFLWLCHSTHPCVRQSSVRGTYPQWLLAPAEWSI